MSTFIALPVGQGDAFYLARENFRVLVDGGKSKSAISPWMHNICKTDHLDVLVCTHNDNDHANGVIGLLDNWSGSISEVWLPGSWSYRMRDLFEKPHAFCRELVDNISEIGSVGDQDISLSLETFASRQDICVDLSKKSSFNLDELIDMSKEIPRNFLEFCLECSEYDPYWFHSCCTIYSNSPLISLFKEAINAASNIRQIVDLAYHRGCKIRFFEYGNKVSGGLPLMLVPMNSQEMISLRPAEIEALFFLALTTANKESLVFYSPENENEPPVLFTADSDLSCSLSTSPDRSPIVTSPHHGAEANANAYKVVSTWLRHIVSPIWVRSDCKSKARPGNTFKNQLVKNCTLCNCGTNPKQTVKFHSRLGHWHVTKGTRRCSCK